MKRLSLAQGFLSHLNTECGQGEKRELEGHPHRGPSHRHRQGSYRNGSDLRYVHNIFLLRFSIKTARLFPEMPFLFLPNARSIRTKSRSCNAIPFFFC